MGLDLYSVLGVGKDASQKDIKQAYKRIAMKYHPDRNPGDKAAEEKFKEVSRAFEILGDPDKRKLYDEFGEEGLKTGFDPAKARAYKEWANRGGWSWQGGPGTEFHFDFGDLFSGGGGGNGGFRGRTGSSGGGGFEDLFGSIFGGGRRSARPRGAKGGDSSVDLEVDVATAIRGDEIPLRLTESAPGQPPRVKNLKVKVPAGVGDGSKIRLRGQGQPGLGGGPPGDLLLNVKLKVDPPFERHGDQLVLEVPITLSEAIDGARVWVPTPERGRIRLRIPPGSQSGDRLRAKGKGLPMGPGKPRGDLIVRLLIKLPEDTSELAEVARKVERKYRDIRANLGV